MKCEQDVIMAAQLLLEAWNRNFQAMPDEVEDGLIALNKVFKLYTASRIKSAANGEILASMPSGRQAVLRTLQATSVGLSDTQLYEQLKGTMTRGQVQSRRAELVQMGLVFKDTGQPGHRRVWRAQ